jgi:uncharacterized protein
MRDKMGTRQGETMSELTTKQPAGTPTWIDLGIPDLDRAMTFYGALFGWEFDVGPAEFGHYTQVLATGQTRRGHQAEPRSRRHGLLVERLLRDG